MVLLVFDRILFLLCVFVCGCFCRLGLFFLFFVLFCLFFLLFSCSCSAFIVFQLFFGVELFFLVLGLVGFAAF